jgi:hypothetical protein
MKAPPSFLSGNTGGKCGCGTSRITLENILNLNPGQTDPVFEILVIYLKYEKDFGVVKRVLEQTVDAVSTVYVVADLCSDELLVEIEGVGGFSKFSAISPATSTT